MPRQFTDMEKQVVRRIGRLVMQAEIKASDNAVTNEQLAAVWNEHKSRYVQIARKVVLGLEKDGYSIQKSA